MIDKHKFDAGVLGTSERCRHIGPNGDWCHKLSINPIHEQPLTYDEAENKMLAAGIPYAEMQHDCNETDAACQCAEEKHSPGDTRCANRAKHSPCIHDRELAKRYNCTI
jgi:hypothetical protein